MDGEIKDLVPKMQVDRYKMHDIEVVIDRMKVRRNSGCASQQSVQQTLKMGKDLMFVHVSKDDKKPDIGEVVGYSRQLMCEDTGITYEEPSPNSFSFNSPYGACPVCKGLGTVYQINMESIIPDRELSITEGGIVPLGEARDAFVYKQVEQLSKKNKFSLKDPIRKISASQLEPDPVRVMKTLTIDVDDGIRERICTRMHRNMKVS